MPHDANAIRPETEPNAPRFTPGWVHRDDLPTFVPLAGLTMRVFAGGQLMVSWIRIEPHHTLPIQEHPHEQLGVVLEGAIEVTIGGETRRLGPGHAYTIPPHVPHGGVTQGDACLVLEAFTPPREDLLALAAAVAGRGTGLEPASGG